MTQGTGVDINTECDHYFSVPQQNIFKKITACTVSVVMFHFRDGGKTRLRATR